MERADAIVHIQWLQNKKEGLERKFKTKPIILLGRRHEGYVEYNKEYGKWEWKIVKTSSNWYNRQEISVILLNGLAVSPEEARAKAEYNLRKLALSSY